MEKCYSEVLKKCFEDLQGVIKSGDKKIQIENNKIELLYFNKKIKIDLKSNNFEGVEDDKEKIIILHYLCKFKDGKNDELITYKNLPDGNFYFPSIYSRVYFPVIEKYKKNPSKFIEKCIEIGGEKISDFSIKFTIFPDIFFIFELIPEDEEFPADLKILFNRKGSEIFEIEDLAVIGEIIESKII
jgi:hypothetical protein